MSKVLFASNRGLDRAENIRAVWDAYDGQKSFTDLGVWRTSEAIRAGDYDVLVTDEFPSEAKAPVVMIFHGAAGGKTYGLDQPHPYLTQGQSDLLTWVVISGEDMVEMMAKQCGVSWKQALPYGMPRFDAYVGKHKGDGHTYLADKRSYLYAPTFRNMHEHSRTRLDLDRLDAMLSDDEIFVIKNHMANGETILLKRYRHIVQASSDIPSAPYLIDCDVLITDYSSILFDAHMLGKPVVLYENDFEQYGVERGMTLMYPDGYASRHCRTEEQLVKMIRSADGPKEKDIRCRQKVCGACDGHATDRVVSLIKDIVEGRK